MYIKAASSESRIGEFTLTTTDYEVIIIQINCSIFCFTYRPADADVAPFLCFLDKLFDFINMHRYKLFVAGDFNIDMSSKSCDQIAFSSLLKSSCFCNTVTISTRISLERLLLFTYLSQCGNWTCYRKNSGIRRKWSLSHCIAFVDISDHQLKHAHSPSLFQWIIPTAYRNISG